MTVPWNDTVSCPDCGWTVTLAGVRIPGHVAGGHVRNPSARTLCSGVGYFWPNGSQGEAEVAELVRLGQEIEAG